jgi:hypothetical protein
MDRAEKKPRSVEADMVPLIDIILPPLMLDHRGDSAANNTSIR